MEVVGTDLSTPEGVQRLITDCGEIDILVNNAGAIPPGTVLDVDEQTWRQAWDLKVFGYIKLTRALYPQLSKRQGVIVNVIGAAGERAGTGGLHRRRGRQCVSHGVHPGPPAAGAYRRNAGRGGESRTSDGRPQCAHAPGQGRAGARRCRPVEGAASRHALRLLPPRRRRWRQQLRF